LKKIRNTAIIFLLAWLVFAQSCMFFRISDKEAADSFNANGVKAEIRYDDIGGIQLHYVKTGQDSFPTLFFIHGSPGSWDAFKRYLEDTDLLQKFRMVSVDRPGFGYSNFGHALNLDEQSTIISVLLRQLKNGRPVYFIGHSLGGPMCVRLAIDNPGMAAGLVLLAAAIDPAQEKPEQWRKALMNNPLQYLVPGAMRPSNYELWYLKADLKKLKPEIQQADLPFIWMIHGNKDQMVPYENVAFAKQNFNANKLEVITINDANHFIPWSHYGIIKDVLMRLPMDSVGKH
jgi:pimeloyl-ACP methyl ester carboxylesterase